MLLAFPAIVSYTIRDSFNSAVVGLILVYAASWSLILSFTVIYRISPFHPLYNFPGPLACKISKFWLAFLTRSGKAHEYIHQLHEKYGDVVRTGGCFPSCSYLICSYFHFACLGPNELSVTHKDLATSVMSSKGLPRGPCQCSTSRISEISLNYLNMQTSTLASTRLV